MHIQAFRVVLGELYLIFYLLERYKFFFKYCTLIQKNFSFLNGSIILREKLSQTGDRMMNPRQLPEIR